MPSPTIYDHHTYDTVVIPIHFRKNSTTKAACIRNVPQLEAIAHYILTYLKIQVILLSPVCLDIYSTYYQSSILILILFPLLFFVLHSLSFYFCFQCPSCTTFLHPCPVDSCYVCDSSCVLLDSIWLMLCVLTYLLLSTDWCVVQHFWYDSFT